MKETQTVRRPVLVTSALLLVMFLVTVACSFGGFSLSGDKATITITLTQDQLNKVFQNTKSEPSTDPDRLLDKITSVELHDGYIRFIGTYTNDGNELTGSFDMSVGVENDALKLKIIAVDIKNVTMDDPRIVKANDKMAQDLTQSVSESKGEVKFKEATVTEGKLTLKIEVNVKTK